MNLNAILNRSSKLSPAQPDSEDPESDFYDFFSYKVKRGVPCIEIIYEKHIKLLVKRGFLRYDDTSKNYRLIHINNNIAKEVERFHIIQNYRKFIKELPEKMGMVDRADLLQQVDKNMSNLFAKDILLQMVRKRPVSFQEDSDSTAYKYFKNCFVEINQDGITPQLYSKLGDKIVFDYEIHEREFEPLSEEAHQRAQFAQFIRNVAGYKPAMKKENAEKYEEKKARYDALCRILGYLSHTYVGGKRKAIVFTDGRVSEEADGRSGKGLMMKGIKAFMNPNRDRKIYADVSGKDFNPRSDTKWQELAVETKTVHLDDVQPNFSIEDLFVDIDNRVRVKQAYARPFSILAKFAITTNKTIRIPGGSAADRVVEFETADHYSADHTPRDEFNCWFFKDWDDEEWRRFDNFMSWCVYRYLADGLTQVESIALEQRKLREETCIEFVEFMSDWTTGKIKVDGEKELFPQGEDYNFTWNTEVPRDSIMDTFCRLYKDYAAMRSDPRVRFSSRFLKWLRLYCRYHSDFERMNKDRDERRSNGAVILTFRPSEAKRKEIEEAKKKAKEAAEAEEAKRKETKP